MNKYDAFCVVVYLIYFLRMSCLFPLLYTSCAALVLCHTLLSQKLQRSRERVFPEALLISSRRCRNLQDMLVRVMLHRVGECEFKEKDCIPPVC